MNDITLPRAELQQALDALENNTGEYRVEGAKNILREALAQPEQEPVALVIDGVLVKSELPEKYTGHLYTAPPQRKPEQEPTAERAWFTIAELNAWADKKLSENPHWVMPKDKPERDEPPPQRKPLKLREIEKCIYDANNDPIVACRNVEAAHGIKENT